MSIRAVALALLAAACVYGVRAATTTPAEPVQRPTASAASETLEDGTVKLSPGSQSFVEVQAVGGGGGSSVTSPARVDFRDGAVAQVGVPLAGRVVTVHVKVGDHVRQGDPLLTLDCPEAASTRAGVQQTQATLREARATLDRQTRMMAEGVGVERERIAAETRVSELEAELARQQASAAFVGGGTGTTVVVNDTYIRESILTPQMKLVAGYQPLMPTFQGLVNEEGLMSLIEYIKSLPSGAQPAATQASAAQTAPVPAQGGSR